MCYVAHRLNCYALYFPDHRASVFIPEIGQSFACPRSFRVFGAQNPMQQGGGRKGLPKSFLNRFTKVHLERFSAADLESITRVLYPQVCFFCIGQASYPYTRVLD